MSNPIGFEGMEMQNGGGKPVGKNTIFKIISPIPKLTILILVKLKLKSLILKTILTAGWVTFVSQCKEVS